MGLREQGKVVPAPHRPLLYITVFSHKYRFTEQAAKYSGLYSLKLGTETAVLITDYYIIIGRLYLLVI